MAIRDGEQKYGDIHVPILALCVIRHDLGPVMESLPRFASFQADATACFEAQAKAFESVVPSARVIRLSHANHYVFLSNEAEVLREMRAFISGLP